MNKTVSRALKIIISRATEPEKELGFKQAIAGAYVNKCDDKIAQAEARPAAICKHLPAGRPALHRETLMEKSVQTAAT